MDNALGAALARWVANLLVMLGASASTAYRCAAEFAAAYEAGKLDPDKIRGLVQ